MTAASDSLSGNLKLKQDKSSILNKKKRFHVNFVINVSELCEL